MSIEQAQERMIEKILENHNVKHRITDEMMEILEALYGEMKGLYQKDLIEATGMEKEKVQYYIRRMIDFGILDTIPDLMDMRRVSYVIKET